MACAFSPSAVFHSPFGGILNNRKIVTFDAQPSMDDLAIIRKMIEKENVIPRVDRIYTLEETGEALKYLAAGNARGKVVIKIAD